MEFSYIDWGSKSGESLYIFYKHSAEILIK